MTDRIKFLKYLLDDVRRDNDEFLTKDLQQKAIKLLEDDDDNSLYKLCVRHVVFTKADTQDYQKHIKNVIQDVVKKAHQKWEGDFDDGIVYECFSCFECPGLSHISHPILRRQIDEILEDVTGIKGIRYNYENPYNDRRRWVRDLLRELDENEDVASIDYIYTFRGNEYMVNIGPCNSLSLYLEPSRYEGPRYVVNLASFSFDFHADFVSSRHTDLVYNLKYMKLKALDLIWCREHRDHLSDREIYDIIYNL